VILSIVIPAFNESRKIAGDVVAASHFLAANQMAGEVIIADDGSTDGTADLAQATSPAADIGLHVLRLAHAGKGSAVRQGILHSRGQFVLFADAGVCIPFEDALRGLAMLQNDECDLAHGSRRLPGSVITRRQTPYRAALSQFFRWSVLRYMHLPRHLTDTQCGFKLYRGHLARELYAECRTPGFMFDMEILTLAARRGLRIAEFPVHWRWDSDSRLKPMRIAWGVLGDLRRIRKGGRWGW
jgi:dolichyl-phosphate beta-glucosyltransferase